MPVPDDGEPFFNAPDRPFSGVGTPWSVPMHVVREGDRAVCELVMGPAFEGAPGMAHGGVVAGIYDDLLGFLLMLQGTVAFTAYLTVNYHQATKVGEHLRFEAWVERTEGKKLYLAAECHSGDELITSSDGLFIDALEHFTR
jgi:acyl-coenzyme A thioesterase PaaI-like protein